MELFYVVHPAVKTSLDEFDGGCLDCGYLLRGLPSTRCPECGRTFDPDDALSYSAYPWIPRIWQRLMRPIGDWVKCAVIVAFAMTVYAGSLLPPGGDIECLWQAFLLFTPWTLLAVLV